MVVRSGPRRGVGIEAPQQHSAVGFSQLVQVAGRESPGHTAIEHDLEYFRLQETDLVCHCDVWVVVHRPAVLEEAVPGVASTAFDLRANVPNAADGAAKIHLQETDLVCHCDVWVVVHRPAVLEEAVPGVASTAFDLRANVPNAADGAAKIHEGVDLAVPLPRGLHGNRFYLHGGGAHVHGHRFFFPTLWDRTPHRPQR